MFIKKFMYYFENLTDQANGIMVNYSSYHRLCDLYQYIESHFDPCDGLYEFYIKVDKGCFEDNYSAVEIEDMEAWGTTVQEAEEMFNNKYPDSEIIQHVTIIKHPNNWFVLALNDDKIIQINPDTIDWGHDLCPLIDFLIEELKVVHDLQMHTLYDKEVIQKINLNQRFGTVKAKYVYTFDPQIRDSIFDQITDKEFKEFTDIINNPNPPMPHINLSMYLSACNAGYLANRPYNKQYERANADKSPKDNYRRIADGRDDGMLDLNIDSYNEFEQWLHSSEIRIGHPFEIVTSMDIMNSIHLYPYKDDDGYSYILSCRQWSRTSEIIRFAIAIQKLGYAIRINNYQTILKRYHGETIIGISPNHIYGYRANPYFEDINDYDFAINYDILIQDKSQEDIDVLFSHVTWFDNKYSKIKKDSN